MKKSLLAALVVFSCNYVSAMHNYQELPMYTHEHRQQMHFVNDPQQTKCYEQNKIATENKKQIDRKNKSIKSSNQNWNSGTFYSHRKGML